jgi:hypothetical protein
MTPRKPKPRKPAPRKAAGPTLEKLTIVQYMHDIGQINSNFTTLKKDLDVACCRILAIETRLEALEARKQFRDASHDEPMSNGSEAIGHFTLTEPKRPWWRRFLDHMNGGEQ